jgi:hypothetical protein
VEFQVSSALYRKWNNDVSKHTWPVWRGPRTALLRTRAKCFHIRYKTFCNHGVPEYIKFSINDGVQCFPRHCNIKGTTAKDKNTILIRSRCEPRRYENCSVPSGARAEQHFHDEQQLDVGAHTCAIVNDGMRRRPPL